MPYFIYYIILFWHLTLSFIHGSFELKIHPGHRIHIGVRGGGLGGCSSPSPIRAKYEKNSGKKGEKKGKERKKEERKKKKGKRKEKKVERKRKKEGTNEKTRSDDEKSYILEYLPKIPPSKFEEKDNNKNTLARVCSHPSISIYGSYSTDNISKEVA